MRKGMAQIDWPTKWIKVVPLPNMTKWLLCYANFEPIRQWYDGCAMQIGITQASISVRFQATLQQIPGSVGLSRPTWLGTLGVGKGRGFHAPWQMAWSDPKFDKKHGVHRIVQITAYNQMIKVADKSHEV